MYLLGFFCGKNYNARILRHIDYYDYGDEEKKPGRLVCLLPSAAFTIFNYLRE